MAHLAHIFAHSPHAARVKRHESAVRKRTLDAERHCTRSCGQRRTLRRTHLQHRWEAAALMELVKSGWHLKPPLCTASTAARAAPNHDAHCHSNRVRQVQSGVRPRTAKQRSVTASKMLENGCRPPQRRQPPSREPKPPLVRHTADLWNGGPHNTKRVSDRLQHYMLLPLSTPTQPPPPPLHHKQPPPPPLPRQTKMELSDHRSLSFLKNGKETGGRIARWALSLAEYDYEIEYIKGTDNTLVDLLSRMVGTLEIETGECYVLAHK